jgi:F0F1-type ATP synthase epsilon subunit
LRVLTPQSTVLDLPVERVVAPLPDGWIGILPGHTSFQAQLLRGHLGFQAGGRGRRLATIGGVLSVTPTTVLVLTGAAALDQDLAALEQEIGREATQFQEMEREAEKHFDQVYRALAHTFNHRRRFA